MTRATEANPRQRSAYSWWFGSTVAAAVTLAATAVVVSGIPWILAAGVMLGAVISSSVNVARYAAARQRRTGQLVAAVTAISAAVLAALAAHRPDTLTVPSAVMIALASVPLATVALAAAVVQLRAGTGPEQHPLGVALTPPLVTATLAFLVTVAADSAWWVLLPIVPPLLITAGSVIAARRQSLTAFSAASLRTAGAFWSLALTISLTAQVVAASGSVFVGALLGHAAGFLLAAPAARALVSAAPARHRDA